MIVGVIDIRGVRPFKPEGHAPVAGYRNGMVTLVLTLEGVRAKSRQVHILRRLACMKPGQDKPEPFDMLRPNATPRPRLEHDFKSLVPEAGNHAQAVTHYVTGSVPAHTGVTFPAGKCGDFNGSETKMISG